MSRIFDLHNQRVITLDDIGLGQTDLNPNQVSQIQSETIPTKLDIPRFCFT
ncbi:MAG: hypothetical protein ABF250_10970 [Polaribacter sp.]|jgi:hypothetical protein|uniref:hypothetical protein n=1 Tax=Polaribacter sp. TaxID=1920175 RepID=UPI00260F2BA7|nr:hypothetical protein [uncultured Polaribacter sp.]